jgi:DNA-binding HxlR family transcriptional regulator
MRKQRHETYTHCPVEATLDIIGGKWKSIILFRVLEGTRRFNELRRLIPSLTQRMLTNQLRELERDGLIARKIYAQVPPKVEYSITAFGKTLKPVLLALKNWAEKNMLPRMAEKNIIVSEESPELKQSGTHAPAKKGTPRNKKQQGQVY